ncbi:GNAT family N-acetyltransferase [Sediminicola sp. 1XM1-17]|uniref:GNAT family N-acetyltransferase n=1 Tax=Sediminicola sp. 1XM1-17 TaxID=3127702 RepID=UPI0030780760
MIAREISENRQWKLIIDQKVACIWAVTFKDPEIWQEKDRDNALYIHRIATNPEFRGNQLVQYIVSWAKGYALDNHLDYVRMDTVGENFGLISYYQKCGFKFLGLSKLKDTKSLPKHYHNATVSLFQITL